LSRFFSFSPLSSIFLAFVVPGAKRRAIPCRKKGKKCY
jgi:hypothetical protein